MSDETSYDDTYGTCKYTSVLLHISHPSLQPDNISQQLHLQPSWAWQKGEPREIKGRPARTGMWVLSSETAVQSRDVRRHIDWLIAQLQGRKRVLQNLTKAGYDVSVFCHWVQLGGTGGPTLSPMNMRGLAALDLELGFEFWSEDDDES